jgi:hypothetical protein
MPKPQSREQTLETLSILAAVLLAGFGVFRKDSLWMASLLLLLAGLFLPALASRISGSWLGFSAAVARFNSRLILTVIYYAVLTPVAFVYRLFAGDPLGLRNGRSRADRPTHFTRRDHRYVPADFERPW